MFPSAVLVTGEANDELLESRRRSDLSVGLCRQKKDRELGGAADVLVKMGLG